MTINYLKIAKFFLFLVPFTVILVNSATLFPFIVTKYTWFRLMINLTFLFVLLALLFDQLKTKEIFDLFKRPLVIWVSLFTLIFLLACFFAYNPKFAFWSNFERGEGGFQILHLWLYFLLLLLLLKERKDWQKYILFILGNGILVILYGFLAGLGFEGFIGDRFKDISQVRIYGTIGNPAYLATYTVFLIYFIFYLLVFKSKGKLFNLNETFFFWFLIIFYFIGFILAATRGGFVGFFFSLLVLFSYFIYLTKKYRKKLLVVLIILLILFALGVYYRNSEFVKSLPGSRIFDLDPKSETWQSRVWVWKIAYKAFLDRPILGWGPENFIYIYPKYFEKDFFNPEKGFKEWFDRAHSIYFDYLSQTGILGLISYLAIFISIYYLIFKFIFKYEKIEKERKKIILNKTEKINLGIFLAIPTAYLVQGIVLFDVLPIYLMNFFFFAWFSFEISNYFNFLKIEEKKKI